MQQSFVNFFLTSFKKIQILIPQPWGRPKDLSQGAIQVRCTLAEVDTAAQGASRTTNIQAGLHIQETTTEATRAILASTSTSSF